jgi:hypothetical protein
VADHRARPYECFDVARYTSVSPAPENEPALAIFASTTRSLAAVLGRSSPPVRLNLMISVLKQRRGENDRAGALRPETFFTATHPAALIPGSDRSRTNVAK